MANNKKKIRLKVHYHYDTKNISFLETYKELKDMGIRNNKFFLKIYDESIKNLDPYDEENLTVEEKVKIKRECMRNPWYFLREILVIPVSGGISHYQLHRGNLAVTWLLLKNISTLVEMPRQNGKTIGILSILEWIYDFSTKNSEMAFLHKKYDDSKLNLDRLKKLRQGLPKYLLPEKSLNDVDNLANIRNSRGNTILAKNAAVSEEQADLLGRGNTTPIAYYDEVAFIKYLEKIYTSATPAQMQAALEAEKRGKPHFKVFSTTPGDILTPHGAWCKKNLIEKSAIFDESIYDWSDEKLRDYLDKNSENDMMYVKFNYKQLRRDEKWFRDTCRQLNGDISSINREILLQWNRSTSLSPFRPESIDRLRSFTGEKLSAINIQNSYLLNVYEVFDWNSKLLIGGDFGGSASKDATAFSIVDPLTLHCVADFNNNKADPITVADIIYELMHNFFPNAIFIPEQNGYSDTIISLLLRTDIANRIYFEYKDKKVETKMENGMKKVEKIKVKSYGVNTNTNTRQKMMNIVFDIVENDYENVISPLVIEDIAGLERSKSGKIEHRLDGHDDNLFSYLMTRYVFSYGENLARFRIYKPLNSIAEEQANMSARSDEEYTRNISTVLISNFNDEIEDEHSLRSEIINEYYQRQERNRQYERERNEEFSNMKKDKFISIFNLNKE